MIYEELLTELRKRRGRSGKRGGYSAIARELLIAPETVSDIARERCGLGLIRAEDLANAMGFDIVLVKRDETGRSDPNP